MWSSRDSRRRRGTRRIAKLKSQKTEERESVWEKWSSNPSRELDSLKLISYLGQLAILELRRRKIFVGEQGICQDSVVLLRTVPGWGGCFCWWAWWWLGLSRRKFSSATSTSLVSDWNFWFPTHSGRNVQLRCKNNSIVILSMSIYLFLWGDNHRVRHIFLTFFSNRISNLFGWLYVIWFLY